MNHQIFFLAFGFFDLKEMLVLRMVNKENLALVQDQYMSDKKELSFLERVRSIEKKDWKTESTQPYKGRLRMQWNQSLPPIFPWQTWPYFPKMVSYFVSPWFLKRRGLETIPLFEFPTKKKIWKIRIKIFLEILEDEEDVFGIGVTTCPEQGKFIGMGSSSLGYHLDDGLLCQDGCLLHQIQPTKEKQNVWLEIDYQEGKWCVFIDEQKKFESPFYGEFLYKRLYVVIAGEIERHLEFNVDIEFL